MNSLMNKNNNNFMARFNEFAKQMQGKDPDAILQQKLQSGEIKQEDVNGAVNLLKMLGLIKP